jgi:uncharacterized protein YxeA
MKKNTILILFFLFSFIYVSAQEKIKHSYGSDAIHLKLMKEDDSYKEKFERNNEDWITYATKRKAFNPLANKNSQTLANTPKSLTVVFHDITNNAAPQQYLISGGGSYQYIVNNLNLIYNGDNLGVKSPQNDTQIEFYTKRQQKQSISNFLGRKQAKRTNHCPKHQNN